MPSPRLASVISFLPSMLMMGTRLRLLSNMSKYRSSMKVPFVNIGKRMLFFLLAASMTSLRSMGSPPASRIKLMPRSSASSNILPHSSPVSWLTGSESTVAWLHLE